MDKQVEIKKIVIRIGDKEATLTPEDAKALRDVLNEMFGEKEKEYVPQPYPVYPYWGYYWKYYPNWLTTTAQISGNATSLTGNTAYICAPNDSRSSLG